MSTQRQYLEAAKKQLVAERVAAGLTLDELVEKVSMSRSTLHRLEKGKAVPDLRHLDELAEVYGMTLMDLMRRIDERADLVPVDDEPQPPTADDFGLAAHRPKIRHESMEDDGDHAE